MKIKHYKAPDMRTALRQVKDAQGPDAVILASRRIAGGVEVVAAVDYDGEEAMTEQLAQGVPAADSRRNVSYGAAPAAAQDRSWVMGLVGGAPGGGARAGRPGPAGAGGQRTVRSGGASRGRPRAGAATRPRKN